LGVAEVHYFVEEFVAARRGQGNKLWEEREREGRGRRNAHDDEVVPD
jgi:hypothetical protein